MSKHEPWFELKRTISKHDVERNKNKSKIQEKKNDFHLTTIKVGDRVDLSGFLFTKERNHLINFKNNQKKVNAEDLSGKVIALILKPIDEIDHYWRTLLFHLLDLHSKLHPTGGFEIVFVGVENQIPGYYKFLFDSTAANLFLDTVSTFPFPAFMMSSKESRIFGLYDYGMPISIIIDPQGVISNCHATPLFLRYGATGYPFTKERIDFLDSQDNLARNHPPSVERLLASPGRDYLINSQRDQEPLHTLDNNQVVALLFCPSLLYDVLTFRLKEVYKLHENMKDFEIVFIYTHSWYGLYESYVWSGDHTVEDLFKKAVGKMRWLALPFKDTDCVKKLQRIFQYTYELLGPEPDPMMVIIGPHGNFIEPMGLKTLFLYGASAYPFSRFSAVNLELERAKNLKLEKLWDLDSVFVKKNGSQVRFSQLVGKRIIVLSTAENRFWNKLRELEAIYIKMKGTSDEFEVIQIHRMGYLLRNAKALPWLMYYPFDADSCPVDVLHHNHSVNDIRLVAFDRDGSAVRCTKYPTFGDNMVFPFYPGGKIGDMKNEVLLEVETRFSKCDVQYFCSRASIRG